jgi:NADH:ubiquinone oxidoreductase subunit 4 (subunit M)
VVPDSDYRIKLQVFEGPLDLLLFLIRKNELDIGLAVLLVLLGVYPQPILDTSAASMHGVQQWLGTALSQLASAR